MGIAPILNKLIKAKENSYENLMHFEALRSYSKEIM
jgi:hypothetical protein